MEAVEVLVEATVAVTEEVGVLPVHPHHLAVHRPFLYLYLWNVMLFKADWALSSPYVSSPSKTTHILGREVSLGWNERWNPSLLPPPPLLSHQDANEGKKQVPLPYWEIHTAWLSSLLFLSTRPKKTVQIINQPLKLTLSTSRSQLTVVHAWPAKYLTGSDTYRKWHI